LVKFKDVKMKRVIIFFYILIFLLNLKSDDLKIKRDQKLKNYYYLAKSGTRETKLNVLNNILNEFDQLKYSEKDDKLLEILEFLLNEGTVSIDTKENKVVNNFPDVRRLCVSVLAKLGGNFARDAVINIINYDNDYTVKVEACNIIADGFITDNNKNDLLNTLIKVYTKSQPEAFITSYINALKIVGKRKSFYYSDIIRVLTDISMSKVYSDNVKKMALDAIDYLGEND